MCHNLLNLIRSLYGYVVGQTNTPSVPTLLDSIDDAVYDSGEDSDYDESSDESDNESDNESDDEDDKDDDKDDDEDDDKDDKIGEFEREIHKHTIKGPRAGAGGEIEENEGIDTRHRILLSPKDEYKDDKSSKTIDEITREYCKNNKVTVENITGPKRTRDIRRLRRLLIKEMYKNGHSAADIARYLGRSRSAITQSLQVS